MIPIRYQIGDAELFCIQTERFKNEYFSFRYTLPVTAETAQLNSLLSPVLKHGTRRYPTRLAVTRRAEDLYSTCIFTYNTRGGDILRYGLSADFLGARFVGGTYGILPEVMDLMGEVWLSPVRENGLLRRDFIEREKIALREGIRSAINNPRGYARNECKKLLCAGEPFALPLLGTEDTVDSITPELLTERYETILKSYVPTFWYVGALEPEAVATLIVERLPLQHGRVEPYQSILKQTEGSVAVGEEEMPICQGRLSLGFRTDISYGHPLASAMMVLNEIYGASPASKLFLNVREKRSLCYSCSTSLRLNKGVIYANAGMKPENRAVTEEAMLSEFADIAAGEDHRNRA